MHTSNKQSFMRICSTTFCIALLAYLIQYGLKFFVARHTTPALYRDYAIALRVLNMSAIIALLGTNISSTRFLSSFIKNKSARQASAYISWNIHFISRSFIFCFILATLSALGGIALYHMSIKDIGYHHLAIYMLWIALFLSLALLLGNYFLCKRATVLSSILTQFTLYSILLLLVSIGVLWLNITLDTSSISWIIFVAVATLLSISFVVSLHHFPALLG